MDTENNENNMLENEDLEQVYGGKSSKTKSKTVSPNDGILLSKGICPHCKKKITPYNNSKNKFTCASCKVFYVQASGLWSVVQI